MLLELPELLLLLAYYLDVFTVFGFDIPTHKVITVHLLALRYLFVEHISVNIWLQLGRLIDAKLTLCVQDTSTQFLSLRAYLTAKSKIKFKIEVFG
jgi:hypothetical protein